MGLLYVFTITFYTTRYFVIDTKEYNPSLHVACMDKHCIVRSDDKMTLWLATETALDVCEIRTAGWSEDGTS